MTRDDFVNLRPPHEPGQEIVQTIRLVGRPLAFAQYIARTRDRERVDVMEFPDAQENRAFTRLWSVSEEIYGADPWKAAGYCGTVRYAQNCICLEGGVKQAKILVYGRQLVRVIVDLQDALASRGKAHEYLGEPGTPYISIGSRRTADRKPVSVDYSAWLTGVGMDYEIDEHEIGLLRAAGEPDWNYLENFPDHEGPEWLLYGHPLHRVFAPSPWPGTTVPNFKPSFREGLLDEILSV